MIAVEMVGRGLSICLIWYWTWSVVFTRIDDVKLVGSIKVKQKWTWNVAQIGKKQQKHKVKHDQSIGKLMSYGSDRSIVLTYSISMMYDIAAPI